MIPDDLLNLLRCPETGQTLAWADASLLAQVQRNEELPNREKTATAEPLTAALVREDRQVLYPVRDGIPVLLRDQAIRL